jgi:two-component system sensor histidine kinase TctE
MELRSDRGQARLALIDDGPGILDEDWPHVIRPFIRGKGSAEGSGLGLAIVSDVMTAHGGQLAFGRNGEGHFVVSLVFPLAPAPQANARAQEENN